MDFSLGGAWNKLKGFDMNKAAADPMFQMGLGLLGSRGDNAVEQGLLGMQRATQYQTLQAEQERKAKLLQIAEQDRARKIAAEEARKKALGQAAGQALMSGNVEPWQATLMGNPDTADIGYKALLAGMDKGQAPYLMSPDQLSQAGFQPGSVVSYSPNKGYNVLQKPVTPDSVSAPANVREWEYYNNLTPEQQARYLDMKRNGQLVAGTPYNPVGGFGMPPEDVAKMKADQAAKIAAQEQAIKMSGQAFEQLRPVSASIALLNEADALLEAGADTGPVMSKMPSIMQVSVALDNVQAQLGLNVIENTTFGALSEAELKFALDTAMPVGLDQPALRDWIKRKRDAQMKLYRYLQDAAIYLGTPGNTIADFLKDRRSSHVRPSGSEVKRKRYNADGTLVNQ